MVLGRWEKEAGADLHRQEAMPIAWDQWLELYPKVGEGRREGVTLKQGPVAVSLKSSPQTNSISTTCEFVRNVGSQAPPQTYHIPRSISIKLVPSRCSID